MNEERFGTPVRRLTLKRRRSPLPWIYVVYHARAAPSGRARTAGIRYASVCRRRNAGTSSGSNSGPGVSGTSASLSSA